MTVEGGFAEPYTVVLKCAVLIHSVFLTGSMVPSCSYIAWLGTHLMLLQKLGRHLF